MSIKEAILKAAAFSEHEAWRRCGYDSEKEPGIKEIVGGARGENLALQPLILALADCVEALERTQCVALSYRLEHAPGVPCLRCDKLAALRVQLGER